MLKWFTKILDFIEHWETTSKLLERLFLFFGVTGTLTAGGVLGWVLAHWQQLPEIVQLVASLGVMLMIAYILNQGRSWARWRAARWTLLADAPEVYCDESLRDAYRGSERKHAEATKEWQRRENMEADEKKKHPDKSWGPGMPPPDHPDLADAKAKAREALLAMTVSANEISAAHRAINDQIISKLKSGELIARGFKPLQPDVEPKLIRLRPEIWGAVAVNIPQSTVTGGMVTYIGVRVKAA